MNQNVIVLISTIGVAVILTVVLSVVFTLKPQSEIMPMSRNLTFQEAWPQFKLNETIVSTGETVYDSLQPGDQYGTLSVNKNATILAVGASLESGKEDRNPSVGAVYISVCQPSACKQVFMLRGENTAENFGESVVVSNTRIFVISWEALYIYQAIETCSDEWKLEHKFGIEQSKDVIKYDIVVSDDNTAVLFSELGHVKLIKFQEQSKKHQSQWKVVQEKYINKVITASAIDKTGKWMAIVSDDNTVTMYQISNKIQKINVFDIVDTGVTVSFSQDGMSLAVGCPYAEDMKGMVVMFQRETNNKWYKKSDYRIENSLQGDCFGHVALSPNGCVLAVGAPSQVNYLTDSTVYGSIYFFQRKNTTEDFQLSQKVIYPGQVDSRWNLFGSHMAFSSEGDIFFTSAVGSNDVFLQGGAVYKYLLQ